MPDHLEGSEWVWNTFPAYCYPERLRVTMAYKDTKCISDTEDRIDYCNLTKLAYKIPDRANDLTYRCNVYNGTTGTFFTPGTYGLIMLLVKVTVSSSSDTWHTSLFGVVYSG